MTRTATYQLKRYRAKLPHWARVTVAVEPSDHDGVESGDAVFAWLRDVYGPDAWTDGVEQRRFLAEAIEGVEYVLALPARPNRHAVTVVQVVTTPVDTMPGDVKLAAALACRDALGLELADPPRLEDAGAFFP